MKEILKRNRKKRFMNRRKIGFPMIAIMHESCERLEMEVKEKSLFKLKIGGML